MFVKSFGLEWNESGGADNGGLLENVLASLSSNDATAEVILSGAHIIQRLRSIIVNRLHYAANYERDRIYIAGRTQYFLTNEGCG